MKCSRQHEGGNDQLHEVITGVVIILRVDRNVSIYQILQLVKSAMILSGLWAEEVLPYDLDVNVRMVLI